jgi:hypothetical protein
VIDGQNEFALSYLLYMFWMHDGVGWVTDGEKIDGAYLEQIGIAMIENKRLRMRYSTAYHSHDKHHVQALFTPRPSVSAKFDYYMT